MSESYQVFARKYRPRTFDDVLGQDHVVQTLKNAIEQDRLAHAYLFVGPRGTGKTSTARILAKALNCPGGPKVDFDPDDPICVEIAEGNSLDVLEIDGASNNGVEQVRELRDTVKFAPSSGQFKIYYIDEVHMLTTAAFNALLKTLEEPPPHVKFIFATTEPQKILPTIISRCQRFDLRRIPTDVIAQHLLHIASEESIELDEAAAFVIAKGAEGGMRDAQSMLDQLVAFCGNHIEQENVLEIFGFNSVEAISGLAGSILRRETSKALEEVHTQSEAGRDLSRLLADLIAHFRNVLVIRVDPEADTAEMPPEILDDLREQAAAVETPRLLRLIDLLAETDARMKWAPNKKLHLEIGVIKGIEALGEASIDDVIALVSGAAESAEKLPASAGPVSASRAQGEAEGLAPAMAMAVEMPAPVAEPTEESAPAAVPGEAAPEEAPAPDPAPDPAPAPGPGLEGEALWTAAQAALSEEAPLLDTWLAAARFLSHEGKDFTIGFAAEQRFFRESLSRHEADIAAKLSLLAGGPITLHIEVRDDLEAAEFAIEEETEPVPEPPPASEATAPTPETSAPQDGPPPEEATPGEEAKDDSFQNDPLITEALEAFEARIIKS